MSKRIGWRIVAWGGAVVFGLALFLGGFAFVFFRTFYPPPPTADYPPPRNAVEAQHQDLDYLHKLIAMDRSFSPQARQAAERRITQIEGLNAALEPQRLAVAVMQIMALADNGHTRATISTSRRPLLWLPVRVTRFADGFFVMRATEPYRELLGGQIVSIDGVAFADILSRLETLRGGTESYRRDDAAALISIQDVLYGIGIAKNQSTSVWTVQLASGATVTRSLAAAPYDSREPQQQETRWLSPEPVDGMGAQWTPYRPARGTLPPSLTHFDTAFLRFRIRQSCAEYIRVQDITDNGDQKIAPFLDETEAALRTAPPCAIVLDLRYNGGGNYTNMWHFAKILPSLVRPGGRIFVLTDPETFSAAITTTAFVKQAAGASALIVGEPVGDRLGFYAEGGDGCLPNSHLCAHYATGRHDYTTPCRPGGGCFWTNWFFPVAIRSLEPDVAVPLRFADWNAGHDAAYERAVSLAR